MNPSPGLGVRLWSFQLGVPTYVCNTCVLGNTHMGSQRLNHIDSLHILYTFKVHMHSIFHTRTGTVLPYAQKCQINITLPKSSSKILAAKDDASKCKQYSSVHIPMTSSKWALMLRHISTKVGKCKWGHSAWEPVLGWTAAFWPVEAKAPAEANSSWSLQKERTPLISWNSAELLPAAQNQPTFLWYICCNC